MRSVTRREFEGRVNATLGPLLSAHGFVLAAQAPAEVSDPRPTAYFEAPVETLHRDMPRLAARLDTDADHVDVTVQWHDPVLEVDLANYELDRLLAMVGLPQLVPDSLSLDAQLGAAADALARILPTLAE